VARLASAGLAAVTPDGGLCFVDYACDRIRLLDSAGQVDTIAPTAGWNAPARRGSASDDDPASDAVIGCPSGLAVAPDGTVYVSDSCHNRVWKIHATDGRVRPGATVTLAAGDGWLSSPSGGHGRFAGDGGPAVEASLREPLGLAVGPDGSLYIADSVNHRVRKVAPDGIITTVAGNAQFYRPEYRPHFAGEGGPATRAPLGKLEAVAIGPDGSLFIADSAMHRILKVWHIARTQ
jgi:sugar lactone lactonase YvrE